jgi:apolipoprotein D and lipocalin family protein
MRKDFVTALVLALAAGTAGAQTATLPNASVPALDLQRYAGEWHEIAHLPMFFQRNCVANITATYSNRADGTIGVRNACDGKDGKRLVSEGAARPVAGHPGRLQVRFAPDWLAWVPLVWADYWVVELDPGYGWAVVGGPGRDYLWILSRTPRMDRATYDAIRARAAQRGYPVEKLLLPANTLE